MSKPKNPEDKQAIKNKEPRKCITCATTKPAEQFSRQWVYICERCYEKR